MKDPVGIDIKKPRFSWKLSSKRTDVRQKSYHITVGTKPGRSDFWDSGEVISSISAGTEYEGKELTPCTQYFWQVTVVTQDGDRAASEHAFFETGLLNPSISAWNGAEWIGPSECTLSADVRGVFSIEMEFAIHEGSTCMGLVFGRNDRRIQGRDNYFRFDTDVSTIPAKLLISRVGITDEDAWNKRKKPLYTIIVADVDDAAHRPVITEDNRYGRHTLTVKVTGNCAYTYMDGIRIDAVKGTYPWGEAALLPRQLNPYGSNDVNTWPRLNEIGYALPAGQSACLYGITVRNNRKPGAVIYEDGKVRELQADDHDVLCTVNPSHTSEPILRRIFTLKKKQLQKARLYATARGIYECRINGQSVTDTRLNPGVTQYDRHLMYQTYRIEHLLQPGENVITVVLSSGWWSDAQTYVTANYNYYGDRTSFLGMLTAEYTDGTMQQVVTDPQTWKYCDHGPWTYAGLFNGEHYDARRMEEIAGYELPGFDDTPWSRPVEIMPIPIDAEDAEGTGIFSWPAVNQQEPLLVGQSVPPIGVRGKVQAVSVTEIRKGVYIYDMGANMAGVPSVRIFGKKGMTAQLRFAEVLCPDLPEFAGRAGTLMVENLRDADCTDLYTFAGNPDGEEYTPVFTFRGYRYIEISGVSKKPELSDVHMLLLSSVERMSGKVRVSDDLVNLFLENVQRSQRSNFIGIPTDCPQRNERMGWNGDTSIFARTATFNADVRLFYANWLQMTRDLQEADGRYTDISPVGGGFGGYTYDSAPLHVTWEVYQQYQDTAVIRENYAAMEHFMKYSAEKWQQGDLAAPMTLGDWLAPEETDIRLICHAFYGYNARIMARMSAAVGETEKADAYEKLYRSLRRSFCSQYIDPDTGRTKDHTQCSYALPLSMHMIEEPLKGKVGNCLAEKTGECGYLVNTGFFGTAPLNPMLTETGHFEEAFRLMEQKKNPSWLYPVTQGATSVWERWDSYTGEKGFGGHNNMNSFNHYSLGAVYEWFYRYVLGIRRQEEHPGYSHFRIRPQMKGWKWAEGGFESPYGRIEVSWVREDPITSKQGSRVTLTVRIPENSAATVILPGDVEKECGSGRYVFEVPDDMNDRKDSLK
jgi:alpha-L-rhamnosidase